MKKVIAIILCLAWMGFIFYNSSQNGLESNARSEEFLKNIKKYYIEMKNTVKKPKSVESFNVDKEAKKAEGSVGKNNNTEITKGNTSDSINKSNNSANDKKLKFQNYLVRKGAHALEYIILAILIANAFWQFGIRNKNVIVYVLFITLFYAVLDEFHQSFVSKRTSEVGDILLDFSGAIFGTITWYTLQGISLIVKRRFSKTQNNGI